MRLSAACDKGSEAAICEAKCLEEVGSVWPTGRQSPCHQESKAPVGATSASYNPPATRIHLHAVLRFPWIVFQLREGRGGGRAVSPAPCVTEICSEIRPGRAQAQQPLLEPLGDDNQRPGPILLLRGGGGGIGAFAIRTHTVRKALRANVGQTAIPSGTKRG